MRRLCQLVTLPMLFIIAINSGSGFANTVVRYSHAEQRELQNHSRIVGTLRAYSQSNIAATEPGEVVKVWVKEGDQVKKQQVLVSLDKRKQKARVEQLTAELALSHSQQMLAEAELAQAEADYQAFQVSAKKQAISEQGLRQSQTEALTAKARMISAKQAVKAAEATLVQAKIALQNMDIRAAFDGQVIARQVEPGQWLNMGDSAITLNSSNNLEAWFDVPERFAGNLSEQQAITLQVQNQSLNADSFRIVQNVNERARTFRVIVPLTNISNVMAGMSSQAWLPEGPKQRVLTVPKDAIVQQGAQTLVYKIVTEGDQQTAVPVNVKVSFYQQAYAAIYAPNLTSGDKVVTEGNERLYPGPVSAVPDEGNLAETSLKNGTSTQHASSNSESPL